jgi:hypothetical protein
VRHWEIESSALVGDDQIGIVDNSWNIMTTGRFDPL